MVLLHILHQRISIQGSEMPTNLTRYKQHRSELEWPFSGIYKHDNKISQNPQNGNQHQKQIATITTITISYKYYKKWKKIGI